MFEKFLKIGLWIGVWGFIISTSFVVIRSMVREVEGKEIWPGITAQVYDEDTVALTGFSKNPISFSEELRGAVESLQGQLNRKAIGFCADHRSSGLRVDVYLEQKP